MPVLCHTDVMHYMSVLLGPDRGIFFIVGYVIASVDPHIAASPRGTAAVRPRAGRRSDP